MTPIIYTHFSTYRGQVYLRYIDKGIRSSSLFDYKPKYYIESDKPNTETKTIFGKPLIERSADNCGGKWRDSVGQYKDVENMDVYGIADPALQFINEKFGNVDLLSQIDSKLIRRLNLDIETTTDHDVGFPNIDEANEEVTLISCLDSTRNKTVCFLTKNVTEELFKKENVLFIHCENEIELLTKFLEFWSRDYPDIVSGWNISQFDIPYLMNRIERVLFKGASKRFSPLEVIYRSTKENDYGRKEYNTTIQGVEIIDSLDLYRNIELKPRESYSLEFISSFELNVGKLRHPSGVPGHSLYKTPDLNKIKLDNDWGEWEEYRLMILEELKSPDPIRMAKISQHFYDVYVMYNVIDVRRAFEVEEVKGLFEITYFLTYYSFSNYSDTLSSMRTWTNLLSVYCMNNHNMVFSMNGSKGKKTGKYAGAYVRDPIVGRYSGVGSIVSFDVASMYPNMIRLLNISPETIMNKKYDIVIEELLEHSIIGQEENESVGANGAVFTKDFPGVLPSKVKELFDIRKAEKSKSKDMFNFIKDIDKEMEKRT